MVLVSRFWCSSLKMKMLVFGKMMDIIQTTNSVHIVLLTSVLPFIQIEGQTLLQAEPQMIEEVGVWYVSRPVIVVNQWFRVAGKVSSR